MIIILFYITTIFYNGIPESAILKEDKATNTLKNAELSYEVIKEQSLKIEKAIIVCKNYYAQKAFLTYSFVFPKIIKFIIYPIIDQKEITKENWYQDELKSKMVMGEVEKIGKYFSDRISSLAHQQK